MSILLSPANIGGLSLKNRVALAPMCMLEVPREDGVATPFHFAHYGARAIANVGLIILEATAVEPDGRIHKFDLGIWNDEQTDQLQQLVEQLHYLGSKVGIQLAHAGRKAKHAQRPIAPSPIAFNEQFDTPHEMTLTDIHTVQQQFVDAARRAQQAGFDMVELHAAHGYLINQFLSPLTNRRQDDYGNSLHNRYRFLQEIITRTKQVFHGPIWVRLSLSAFAEGQNSLEDWQQIAQWLEADGVQCIDVSAGGVIDVLPDIPVHEGYQVPFATALKQVVDIDIATVGLLDNPTLCESILVNRQADLILQGRALLRNTNWLADAATALNDTEYRVFNAAYARGQEK
ncbi:NADH:flavin oxidoreductase/NADH oxidase [Aerococcaceae bacterium NML160702]|nr:NADH:flavin oxidoreductase/NADH oxidase [Aerococcaceae bacterium NML160702]